MYEHTVYTAEINMFFFSPIKNACVNMENTCKNKNKYFRLLYGYWGKVTDHIKPLYLQKYAGKTNQYSLPETIYECVQRIQNHLFIQLLF